MAGAHEPVSSRKSPPAPGGSHGSLAPGMAPDRSTVPGQFSERNAKATSVVRPLTQYGTAQELAGVFHRVPADKMKSTDFEQADASFEEVRKSVVAEWPLERPVAAIAPLEPAETAETAGELAAQTAAQSAPGTTTS